MYEKAQVAGKLCEHLTRHRYGTDDLTHILAYCQSVREMTEHLNETQTMLLAGGVPKSLKGKPVERSPCFEILHTYYPV